MTKVALVSGGTGGIGAAICKALEQDGYVVAANHLFEDEAAAEFRVQTGMKTFQWSVTDPKACETGVAQIEDTLGPINVLVNNAGITRDAMFHRMTSEAWAGVVNTNLSSLYNLTHPVWLRMRERRYGRVINMSSVNALKGQAGQVNYSAAKAGQLGFTRSLAQEGAKLGITVNAICPGYIGTDMVRAIDEDVLNNHILPQIPVGRLGEPDEIAHCVSFLASEKAGYITGSTLSVNGGQCMT